MPIYAYKCTACGHAKDVLQKMSDALLTVCPACGQASFQKQLTAAGFQLKGSGWYVTDFRDGNTGAAAGKGEGSNAGESKGKGEDASAAKPAESSGAASGGAASAAPAVAAPTAAPAAAPASSPSSSSSSSTS